MLVRDIMNKDVIKTSLDTPARETARILADNHIGSVIIENNGSVVGILTERDILTAVAKGMDFNKLRAEEIMTRYVIYTTPTTKVENAIKLMIENKIKKLPVLERERLCGIITASDIISMEPEFTKVLGKLMSKKV
jgi:CBS domain-containing protein